MYIYPEIEKNPLLHICITEPVRLGHAEILKQNAHGILAYDHPAHLHLLAADSPDVAEELLHEVKKPYFILCCSAGFASLLERFGLSNHMLCRQAAWLREELPVPDPRLHISVPYGHAFERILSVYHMSSPEEIARQRDAGELFFAMDENNHDVGFVGLHPEGCFGMLEVFPEQRGKGYGTALEKHIIRFCMETDRVPYCQINIENAISMNLQKKLGLCITPETLCMVWNDQIKA